MSIDNTNKKKWLDPWANNIKVEYLYHDVHPQIYRVLLKK